MWFKWPASCSPSSASHRRAREWFPIGRVGDCDPMECWRRDSDETRTAKSVATLVVASLLLGGVPSELQSLLSRERLQLLVQMGVGGVFVERLWVCFYAAG